MTYSSSFLNMLTSRGYLHQATNIEALDTRMSQQTISAYIGFDCTGY
jgi:tyrosyl-tRNA synthetase